MKNPANKEFIRKAAIMTVKLTAKTFLYIIASIAAVMVIVGACGALMTPANFMDVAFVPIVLVVILATIIYFTREALKGVTRCKL